MKFCNVCGSYLRETSEGLWCSKCGKLICSKPEVKVQSTVEKASSAVYVVNKRSNNQVKVTRACPKCGNPKAFRWFSTISGEHAGTRRERTIEHFKCAKCSHSWSTSS